MLRILHNTNFDFIRRWKLSTALLIVFLVPAIVLIAINGFKYSIEFTGGTSMRLEFTQPQDPAAVRAAVTSAGVANPEITTFGSAREYSVKAQDASAVERQAAGAQDVAQRIKAALDERFGAANYTIGRAEGIGPKVGGELRQQASLAMLISFGITLLYLAWRFEWRFALAAVLATVHDIFATLAFMKYLNLEISVFVVGGILTVIGYSLNDKVVVFDRVRELLHTSRKTSLYDLLNRAVNETLPRTVMTGSTTLGTLLALLIFGGEVIRPFAWVLTFGIIIGTFSSIYVASPLLLWIERKWPREDAPKGTITARTARTESVAERGEQRPPRTRPESAPAR